MVFEIRQKTEIPKSVNMKLADQQMNYQWMLWTIKGAKFTTGLRESDGALSRIKFVTYVGHIRESINIQVLWSYYITNFLLQKKMRFEFFVCQSKP